MKKGLTEEQVLKSRQEYGDNRLSEVKSEGFWEKLKGNFGDPMIKNTLCSIDYQCSICFFRTNRMV